MELSDDHCFDGKRDDWSFTSFRRGAFSSGQSLATSGMRRGRENVTTAG